MLQVALRATILCRFLRCKDSSLGHLIKHNSLDAFVFLCFILLLLTRFFSVQDCNDLLANEQTTL